VDNFGAIGRRFEVEHIEGWRLIGWRGETKQLHPRVEPSHGSSVPQTQGVQGSRGREKEKNRERKDKKKK